MIYSSVVSRDLVRIALTIEALNDLDVLACDIQNDYLTMGCIERVWVIAGPEFGSKSGKNMMVRSAQDDGSTKERGNAGNFYIFRGELEYVVILP